MTAAPPTSWAPEDVPIRPAATGMVVRDGPATAHGTLEVLMVRRNLRSEFVGGAYVFPGGGLDPADGGAEAASSCRGRDDVAASAVLGIASGGLAYWGAALRESFEESGLLLAYRSGQDLPLSFADPAEAAAFGRARAGV